MNQNNRNIRTLPEHVLERDLMKRFEITLENDTRDDNYSFFVPPYTHHQTYLGKWVKYITIATHNTSLPCSVNINFLQDLKRMSPLTHEEREAIISSGEIIYKSSCSLSSQNRCTYQIYLPEDQPIRVLIHISYEPHILYYHTDFATTFIFNTKYDYSLPHFAYFLKKYDLTQQISADTYAWLKSNPPKIEFLRFLRTICFDELLNNAVLTLPLEYKDLFPCLTVSQFHVNLLKLCGDIESNPGPIQSRPLPPRHNAPREVRLEKALERKNDKIRTLIKALRQAIKRNKIQAQMFKFNDLRRTIEGGSSAVRESTAELNTSLTRICDFLESSLPTIQASLQSTLLSTTSSLTTIKDDLIKIIIVCILVRLLMVWSHYKTALTVVLGFVFHFFGFDRSIISLVNDLREKISAQVHPNLKSLAEETVYHPYFDICGKIIFAVIAFVCIKKIPGKKDWDNYIMRLDRIPKAVDGSKKIFDYCTEYFSIATDQVKMMVLGKTKEELTRTNGYNEIYEWASEVRKYVELEQRNKINSEPEIASIVESLYTKGLKYQSNNIADREISQLIMTTLRPARELYEYVAHSPVRGGGPRMRPIVVWLIGESGVGKTEMVFPLCVDILRKMGLASTTDFCHKVYARQVETEYFDAYHGQKIIIYDDAFQKKDDKTNPNPEIFEVIRACNTFPQHLHMAALPDKNTFSQAEVLIFTTNNINVSIESLSHPEAFYNRMETHTYKVSPKAEYAIEYTKDGDRSGIKYKKLNKEKLKGGPAINLDVYEFQKMVQDKSAVGGWTAQGEPVNYNNFATTICDDWYEVKQSTLEKLKFLENYAIRAQVYDAAWFRADIDKKLAGGMNMLDVESSYADEDELWCNYYDCMKAPVKDKWSIWSDKISSCLEKVKSKISTLTKEALEIIKEHPYLTALGLIGVFLSALGLYRLFSHGMEEVAAEVGVSGDVKTQKLARRMVEVGSSGDSKTKKLNVKKVEVASEVRNGFTKEQALLQQDYLNTSVNGIVPAAVKYFMKKHKKGCYAWDVEAEVAPDHVCKIKDELDNTLLDQVEAQGCNDQAAHTLITDVLQKNTYRMSYFRSIDNKQVRIPLGNCTFLRGFVFAMPYHFIQALHARRLAPCALINFSQSNHMDIIQVPVSHFLTHTEDSFNLSPNCVRLTHKNSEFRDCVLVNLHSKMCHVHRDIVKHFVKTSDQSKLSGKFNGTLATYHESNSQLFRAYQWLQQIRALDRPITIHLPTDDGGDWIEDKYTQRDCYEYNAPTQVGDCGSMVGIYNHRLERKIIGMHIAGTNESYGYACPLTQESILEAFDIFVKRDFKNISVQIYYEPALHIDTRAIPNVPDGLFNPIGVSTLKVGQANKTALLPSAIYGKLSTPIMKPALLKPTIINGEYIDPLLKGLKKCGVSTAVLPDDQVHAASTDVAQIVLTKHNTMLDRQKYAKILTYEQAIQGTLDDEFMCAINRTTSAGFPYCLDSKGYPGKTKWMGQGENFDFSSPAALQLRKDVENLIEDCKNGKIGNVFFVDTLKDEKREIAKVDAGKTRVFSAGPQHFVVAFRKYFLPFSAWLMHNRIDNEIAVGTNPYSVDWERIAKRMRLKGKKVIAGDFGNFDGSLVAQILWSIFWDIYVEWLSQIVDFSTVEGKDTLQICLGLWTHLVHSVHIYDSNIYMWTHSQPSGNPFTVIINCLYNSIIMRVVWIRIMERRSPKHRSMKWFRTYVSMISYGDDNLLNISDEISHLYNQESISEAMLEIKHEYTDETKTGQMVKTRSLSEVLFLKRGFRFCEELQRHVAPLKKEVIYEMLNWTRNTIDPNEILMTNIETAFREISYHGKEEYNVLRKGILKLTNSLPSVPQILTYEQYLWDAKFLADDMLEF